MSVPFEAYLRKDPYIFVSYAHKDKDVVYNEIKRLYKEGYRIWYDEGIQPATEWPEEIAVAINNCSTFLVFISPQSIKSKNVRNEINFALSKEKKFIAVHIKKTTLPSGLELQMGSIQAIMKFQISDDQYYRKLINTCHPSIKTVYQSIPEDKILKAKEKVKKETKEKARKVAERARREMGEKAKGKTSKVIDKMASELNTIYFVTKFSSEKKQIHFPIAPNIKLIDVIPEISKKFGISSQNICIANRGGQVLTSTDLLSTIRELVEKFGNTFDIIDREIVGGSKI